MTIFKIVRLIFFCSLAPVSMELVTFYQLMNDAASPDGPPRWSISMILLSSIHQKHSLLTSSNSFLAYPHVPLNTNEYCLWVHNLLCVLFTQTSSRFKKKCETHTRAQYKFAIEKNMKTNCQHYSSFYFQFLFSLWLLAPTTNILQI